MHAARARPEIRRAIEVTDAERSEVGNECGGVAKSKTGVQLQPVGGARNCRPGLGGRRRATAATPPRSAAALRLAHDAVPAATARSRARARRARAWRALRDAWRTATGR